MVVAEEAVIATTVVVEVVTMIVEIADTMIAAAAATTHKPHLNLLTCNHQAPQGMQQIHMHSVSLEPGQLTPDV